MFLKISCNSQKVQIYFLLLTFYEVPVSKVREMYHDDNSVMDDKARITKKRFFETFSYEEYGLKL